MTEITSFKLPEVEIQEKLTLSSNLISTDAHLINEIIEEESNTNLIDSIVNDQINSDIINQSVLNPEIFVDPVANSSLQQPQKKESLKRLLESN